MSFASALSQKQKSLPWFSWKGWLIVCCLFVIQILAIVFLGQKQEFLPPPAPELTRFAVQEVALPLYQLENFLDNPLLFASANTHGFSGSAWLTKPKLEYKPWSWRDQSGPINPLEIPLPSPALTFTALEPRLNLTDMASILLKAPVLPLITNNSRLIIEGDLKSRELLQPVTLPIQRHNDVVTNSVLQVAVNPLGVPVSVRLLSGGGSRKADQDALQLAYQLRFKPVRSQSLNLTWGNLIFQWFTLELQDTNSVGGKL